MYFFFHKCVEVKFIFHSNRAESAHSTTQRSINAVNSVNPGHKTGMSEPQKNETRSCGRPAWVLVLPALPPCQLGHGFSFLACRMGSEYSPLSEVAVKTEMILLKHLTQKHIKR